MSNIAATTIPPKEIAAPYGRSPTGWVASGWGLVFDSAVPSAPGVPETAPDATAPERASNKPPRKTLAEAAARVASPAPEEDAVRLDARRRWISMKSAN